MKVLVIGAEGFIGKRLCKELEKIDVKVVKVDKKIGRFVSDMTINDFKDINSVVYLGGVTSKGQGELNPLDCFKENILNTVFVLDKLIELKKKPKFVYTSSVDATDSKQAYGISKFCIEQICEYYKLKGLEIEVFRLPTVIGKGMSENNGFLMLALKDKADIEDKEIRIMPLMEVVRLLIASIKDKDYKATCFSVKLKTVIDLVKEMNEVGYES